jgi:hypothetical protein
MQISQPSLARLPARPAQFERIGAGTIPSIVPVGRPWQTRRVSVEEQEIRTPLMQVGMHIARRGHGRLLTVVE